MIVTDIDVGGGGEEVVEEMKTRVEDNEFCAVVRLVGNGKVAVKNGSSKRCETCKTTEVQTNNWKCKQQMLQCHLLKLHTHVRTHTADCKARIQRPF